MEKNLLTFKDEKHQAAYEALLEEAYLTEEEINNPTPLLRRQLAFLYLVALYQEAYIRYEGEAFYVEGYDELSIGGPTYLLEDTIGESKHQHEIILGVGKQLLRGEQVVIPDTLEEKIICERALHFVNDTTTKVQAS